MQSDRHIEYDYSRLLGLIKERRFTQSDVARSIHINPSTLNQKLNNSRDFTQTEMRRMCNVLQISIADVASYFFCDSTLENASNNTV